MQGRSRVQPHVGGVRHLGERLRDRLRLRRDRRTRISRKCQPGTDQVNNYASREKVGRR